MQLSLHHLGLDKLLQVGPTQAAVPVVRNVTSIHDLTEQVAQVVVRHLGVRGRGATAVLGGDLWRSAEVRRVWITNLRIGLQVVIEDVDRNGEVSGVKGVRSVPALRTELPPLRHHRVEVAQRKQNALEFILLRTHLQGVLENKPHTK